MVRKGSSSNGTGGGGGPKVKKMRDKTNLPEQATEVAATSDASPERDMPTLPAVEVVTAVKPKSKEDFPSPDDDDKDTVLEVQCGLNKAAIYLTRLRQGSRGPCVFFDDAWFTPNEFQQVSGRETAKDWKRSIKHHGKSLKLLMAKGTLTLQPPKCLCEECTGISEEDRDNAANLTDASTDNKKEDKSPVKDAANKDASPLAAEYEALPSPPHDDIDEKSLQKKRKKRRKQKKGPEAELEQPKTDGQTVCVETAESATTAENNYDSARDQDLSSAHSASPPALAAAAAARASTADDDDISEDVAAAAAPQIDSEAETGPSKSASTTGQQDENRGEKTATTENLMTANGPKAPESHEKVKSSDGGEDQDTQGTAVRDDAATTPCALDPVSTKPEGPEINESITSGTGDGEEDGAGTGFKQDELQHWQQQPTPRAHDITYADARASLGHESLKTRQASAAGEACETGGGALPESRTMAARDMPDFSPGNSTRATPDTDPKAVSSDPVESAKENLFSGGQVLGKLLSGKLQSTTAPPGDHTMKLSPGHEVDGDVESKTGCGRRLEFSTEQDVSDTTCGVDAEPLENTTDSPAKEARLLDIIDELRSYKKQIIHRIETQRHTDVTVEKDLSPQIKRPRSSEPEATWRAGAVRDSDQSQRRESKSAPNLTQPLPSDWNCSSSSSSSSSNNNNSSSSGGSRLRRAGSSEMLSGGRDLSSSSGRHFQADLGAKAKTSSPASSPVALAARLSTVSAVNYVSPLPRCSMATSNGHLYGSLAPGASSSGVKSATGESPSKSASSSSAHSTAAGVAKIASTVTTSSTNIPRVSPYYWHPGAMRVPYYPSLYPGMTSADFYSYMHGAVGQEKSDPKPAASSSDRRSLPKCPPPPTYDKHGALDLSNKKRKSDSYVVAADSKKRRLDSSHKRLSRSKRSQENPIDLSTKTSVKPEASTSHRHNGGLPVSASMASAMALGQYGLSADSASHFNPGLLGALSPTQAATDPSTAMSMYQLYLYNMYNQQMAAQQKKGGKISGT